jgi:uncharacterized protein GlcG (DUF336 family)
MSLIRQAGFALAALAFTGAALAQVPQYGPNVSLEQARKAIAAAEAEAKKMGIPMAIAVVDTAGQLVAFARMENTQTASTQIAQEKAMTSAMYRRTTKMLQDLVGKGGDNMRYLSFPHMTPAEGGLPFVIDGKIAGGLGVSGGTSEQDGVVAKAGLDAMK